MGCDDRDWDPFNRERDQIRWNLRAFFKEQDRKHWNAALAKARGNRWLLLEGMPVKPENELPGLEYEVKLAAETLDQSEFTERLALSDRYIIGKAGEQKNQTVYYYAKEHESFCIAIERGYRAKKYFAKHKRGLGKEENIFMREEQEAEIEKDHIVHYVAKAIGAGYQYTGSLEKDVVSRQVLDTKHGRLFSLDYSVVRAAEEVRQLEIEYKGCFPFPELARDRVQLIEDLSMLTKKVKGIYRMNYTEKTKSEMAHIGILAKL